MKNKVYYKRNLPHLQPKGQLFFVTWTLKGTIPAKNIGLIKEEYEEITKKIKDNKKLDIQNRIFFKKFDYLLHNKNCGNHYLKDKKLANIVAESIHFWDNKRIELISYCIMSNHVHLVLRMYYKDENGKELYLSNVLESIKKFSARECNLILGNSGNSFWQHESYDRLIRDKEELLRVISYTLDNPVKAGLCERRGDWEFSYIKSEYNEFI